MCLFVQPDEADLFGLSRYVQLVFSLIMNLCHQRTLKTTFLFLSFPDQVLYVSTLTYLYKILHPCKNKLRCFKRVCLVVKSEILL